MARLDQRLLVGDNHVLGRPLRLHGLLEERKDRRTALIPVNAAAGSVTDGHDAKPREVAEAIGRPSR